MVARLTPRVVAIVVADSPLACIRCTRAAFEASNALGRPIDCPRARRASRAAARRSRPSSSSSSANEARTPATMRPDAFDVSIPSRSDRNTIPRSARSRMVVMTSAALRPSRSMPTTTMALPSSRSPGAQHQSHHPHRRPRNPRPGPRHRDTHPQTRQADDSWTCDDLTPSRTGAEVDCPAITLDAARPVETVPSRPRSTL